MIWFNNGVQEHWFPFTFSHLNSWLAVKMSRRACFGGGSSVSKKKKKKKGYVHSNNRKCTKKRDSFQTQLAILLTFMVPIVFLLTSRIQQGRKTKKKKKGLDKLICRNERERWEEPAECALFHQCPCQTETLAAAINVVSGPKIHVWKDWFLKMHCPCYIPAYRMSNNCESCLALTFTETERGNQNEIGGR